MGFDQGQIILDSDNGAYYTGQTVYGRLVFDQDKSKTIHGICVDFKGFCKVHWTSQHTRRVNDRTETYTVNHDSHEEYFRKKTYVYGDASGEHHLQPGQHEFRFDFPIPVNCPSSFEGSHGHVRYRIKITMLTTGIFSSNKEKMVPVKVFAPLDLNQNPYCKVPVGVQNSCLLDDCVLIPCEMKLGVVSYDKKGVNNILFERYSNVRKHYESEMENML